MKVFVVFLITVVVSFFVLYSCLGRIDTGEPPTVPWKDYSPTVKSRIDRYAHEANCIGLQGEFDQADMNDPVVKLRTGHGNADLMAYIDYQLQQAGCYR